MSRAEIDVKISAFIWSYKVGDNISHNLDEAHFFYRLKESSLSSREICFLNKHIFIDLVGLTEAIFRDFLDRLSLATNHFPPSISQDKRSRIKKYIEKQKVPFKGKDTDYLRVKNYTFEQLIIFLENFELLGSKGKRIYRSLINAGRLRNRIHIYNWFHNYEKDERDVFTEIRLMAMERLFENIIDLMVLEYSRPW